MTSFSTWKLAAAVGAVLWLFGPAGAARAGGYSDILANTDPMYQACMDRCARNDSYGSLTRNGCVDGCAEMRRRFSLRCKKFKTYGDCYNALDKLALNRDTVILENQAWCARQTSHPHKLQGCRDAVAAFYNAASAEELCGRNVMMRPRETVQALPPLPPPGPRVEPLPEVMVFPPLLDTPKYQPVPAPPAQAAPPSRTPASRKPATQKAAPRKKAPPAKPAEEKDAPMPGERLKPARPPARTAPAAQASGTSGPAPAVATPAVSSTPAPQRPGVSLPTVTPAPEKAATLPAKPAAQTPETPPTISRAPETGSAAPKQPVTDPVFSAPPVAPAVPDSSVSPNPAVQPDTPTAPPALPASAEPGLPAALPGEDIVHPEQATRDGQATVPASMPPVRPEAPVVEIIPPAPSMLKQEESLPPIISTEF